MIGLGFRSLIHHPLLPHGEKSGVVVVVVVAVAAVRNILVHCNILALGNCQRNLQHFFRMNHLLYVG